MKTIHDVLVRSPESLGPDATPLDVVTFNEALRRAWPLGHESIDDDYVQQLVDAVLEGRAGRDEQGRDWVQVANARASA